MEPLRPRTRKPYSVPFAVVTTRVSVGATKPPSLADLSVRRLTIVSSGMIVAASGSSTALIACLRSTARPIAPPSQSPAMSTRAQVKLPHG